MSKMAREAVSSAVSSRVRRSFGEKFASRGEISNNKLRRTREETAELTAILLSSFLPCAAGLSKQTSSGNYLITIVITIVIRYRFNSRVFSRNSVGFFFQWFNTSRTSELLSISL